MIEFLAKGGVLMFPLLLCSVAEVAIIIERLYVFWKNRPLTESFLPETIRQVSEGTGRCALEHLQDFSGPVAATIKAGLKAYLNHRQEHYVEKALARAGSRELSMLEHNLRGLNVIANVAPLLGLLGTVTGMIKAFMKIQELGGGVDASQLAGGIWEAMMTTAAGLTVAIPSLLVYNYFMGRINRIETEMKDAAIDLIEAVKEREKDAV